MQWTHSKYKITALVLFSIYIVFILKLLSYNRYSKIKKPNKNFFKNPNQTSDKNLINNRLL